MVASLRLLGALVAFLPGTLAGQEKLALDTSRIEARITHALAPVPPESVHIDVDSNPPLFGTVRFYQGRRQPRLISGEDERPRFATLVVSDSLSALVTHIEDVPKAWGLVAVNHLSTDSMVVESIMQFLALTGVVSPSQVLLDEKQARSRAHPGLLEDASVLKRVRPPRARQLGGRWIVPVYVDESKGVFRYDFTISRDSGLQIRKHLLTRYKYQF